MYCCPIDNFLGVDFSYNVGTTVSPTRSVIIKLPDPLQNSLFSPHRLMSQTDGSYDSSVPCGSVGPTPHEAISVVDQEPNNFAPLLGSPDRGIL